MNFSPHFMCFVKHTKRYVVPKYSQYLLFYPLLKSVYLLSAVENLRIFDRTYLFVQIKKPDTMFGLLVAC
ncbi:hypothetical protein ACLSY8_06605 [Avibacterium avium]|uniref:hypothetical protein n=1 Tax=Avibacterium TaxID=292486 RepID=UPI0039EE8F72